MNGIWLLLVLTGLLTTLAWLEYVLHGRNLRKIPIRIHVNGTRGKSSVTRLIAAGLRAGQIRTCTKTTGTLPRMIFPDGTEFPVHRNTRPNVIEQLRIVAAASSMDVQALVVECMAVAPFLQFLCEKRMIRATHTVITNIRADHLDVMGPTEDDVALAFAGTIPESGTLFTMESRFTPLFDSVCKENKSQMDVVADAAVKNITPDDLKPFSWVEHPDNVALALHVCASFGVDRTTALRGMWDAEPDPGAFSNYEMNYFGGRKIFFANGFAANDPESTETVWRLALAQFPDVDRRIAIFNCRSDRPDRSRQLAQACVTWPAADHYILMGTGTYLFAREARKNGLDASRMSFAEHRPAAEIFEMVMDLAGSRALVMGMGNIADQGLELVRYFRNRSLVKEAA